MRRVGIWSGTIGLLGAIGLAAPAVAAPPQQAGTDTSKAGVVASFTATGCLEPAVTAPIASPEASEDRPAGVKFMLTKVDRQPGASASADADRREVRYLLLSGPELDLSRHVNHKVTVTGTIAPQPTEGASAADRAADPTTRETNLPKGAESSAFHYNLVEVSSLKMVATSCDKQQ